MVGKFRDRICVAFITLVLSIQCFVSCGDHYKADYPEYFSNEYCIDNYVFADPNLSFMQCDTGSVDSFGISNYGTSFYFKAIKNVALEKYLVVRCHTMYSKEVNYRIIKNDSSEMHKQEILSYDIDAVEIYKRVRVEDDKNLCKMGQKCYDEHVISLSDDQIDIFLGYVKENLESSDYTKDVKTTFSDLDGQYEGYCIRVHFDEYETLIWDAQVTIKEGKYYCVFYRSNPTSCEPEDTKKKLWDQYVTDEYWSVIIAELPQELAELLPAP